MTERDNALLDESTLRRALRLESDERPPRFAVAAIVAAASARPRVSGPVAALAALGLAIASAVAVWSALAAFAPGLVVAAFEGALAVVAALAVPASALLALVQQPALPLSLIAALAIATVFELRQRKELAHVDAS
jgi:hypothetical protein